MQKLHFFKVTSYLFSTNMLGPVSPLLDKSRCKNSIFLSSMIPLSTQNPLSRITTKDLLKIGLKIHNNNPTVFPRLCYIGGSLCLGVSLPSTSSRPHRTPDKQQQTVWYSFPNGHGFHGTNIQRGVYLLVQTLMDSSKEFAHPGMKFLFIFLFQVSNICLTSQKQSLYAGGSSLV